MSNYNNYNVDSDRYEDWGELYTQENGNGRVQTDSFQEMEGM
jgi:hypothetical protein